MVRELAPVEGTRGSPLNTLPWESTSEKFPISPTLAPSGLNQDVVNPDESTAVIDATQVASSSAPPYEMTADPPSSAIRAITECVKVPFLCADVLDNILTYISIGSRAIEVFGSTCWTPRRQCSKFYTRELGEVLEMEEKERLQLKDEQDHQLNWNLAAFQYTSLEIHKQKPIIGMGRKKWARAPKLDYQESVRRAFENFSSNRCHVRVEESSSGNSCLWHAIRMAHNRGIEQVLDEGPATDADYRSWCDQNSVEPLPIVLARYDGTSITRYSKLMTDEILRQTPNITIDQLILRELNPPHILEFILHTTNAQSVDELVNTIGHFAYVRIQSKQYHGESNWETIKNYTGKSHQEAVTMPDRKSVV